MVSYKKRLIHQIKNLASLAFSSTRIALSHHFAIQHNQTETSFSHFVVAPSKIKSFPSPMHSWLRWMTSKRLCIWNLATTRTKALKWALITSLGVAYSKQMKTKEGSLSPIRLLIDRSTMSLRRQLTWISHNSISFSSYTRQRRMICCFPRMITSPHILRLNARTGSQNFAVNLNNQNSLKS